MSWFLQVFLGSAATTTLFTAAFVATSDPERRLRDVLSLPTMPRTLLIAASASATVVELCLGFLLIGGKP